MMSNPKELHGNKAKIDPKAKVQSLYESNLITTSPSQEKETHVAVIPDEQVEMARNYVDENKK